MSWIAIQDGEGLVSSNEPGCKAALFKETLGQ